MRFSKYEYLYFFIHKENTSVEFHSHAAYELVYYEEGQGECEFNGKTVKFGPRSYFIFKPGTLHNEYHRSIIKVYCLTFFNNTGIELEEGLFSDQDNTIFNLMLEIKEEQSLKRSYFSPMLDLLASQLTLAVNRQQNSKFETVDELFRIKKFINENFHQEISVSELAKLSGYSYDHFRHIFKKHIGRSPKQYITDKKIEHAKMLLSTSTMYVTDISISCGFSEISQFSILFKKHTGVTPSEYRRSYQEENG